MFQKVFCFIAFLIHIIEKTHQFHENCMKIKKFKGVVNHNKDYKVPQGFSIDEILEREKKLQDDIKTKVSQSDYRNFGKRPHSETESKTTSNIDLKNLEETEEHVSYRFKKALIHKKGIPFLHEKKQFEKQQQDKADIKSAIEEEIEMKEKIKAQAFAKRKFKGQLLKTKTKKGQPILANVMKGVFDKLGKAVDIKV